MDKRDPNTWPDLGWSLRGQEADDMVSVPHVLTNMYKSRSGMSEGDAQEYSEMQKLVIQDVPIRTSQLLAQLHDTCRRMLHLFAFLNNTLRDPPRRAWEVLYRPCNLDAMRAQLQRRLFRFNSFFSDAHGRYLHLALTDPRSPELRKIMGSIINRVTDLFSFMNQIADYVADTRSSHQQWHEIIQQLQIEEHF